jgi:parallel beta-helix repeat protein
VSLVDTQITFAGVVGAQNGGLLVTGGELALRNCTITAKDGGAGYLIIVSAGAKLVVDESVISDSGLVNWGGDFGGFLVSQGAQVMIKNSVFDNITGALDIATGGVTFVNNKVLHTYAGVMFLESGNTIKGNTIADSISGDLRVQAGNAIQGSRFLSGLNPSTSASIPFWLVEIKGGASGGFIKDNNFSNSWGGIYVAGSISGLTVFHNNFVNVTRTEDWGKNSWEYKGEGNYWSTYAGKDSDLDGIGDTPYINGNIVDNYPFMKPNGWLTKFYLTLNTNLPSSTLLSINGSSFNVGKGGTITLRLGYVGSYSISLPRSVSLAKGSSMVFMKWEDGLTSPVRTVKLSSNTSLSAEYTLQAPTITTTTSSTSTSSTTSSSSTTTKSSSSSQTTPTSAGGGGIPEFPLQALAISGLVVVVVLSYLVARRRTPPKFGTSQG